MSRFKIHEVKTHTTENDITKETAIFRRRLEVSARKNVIFTCRLKVLFLKT